MYMDTYISIEIFKHNMHYWDQPRQPISMDKIFHMDICGKYTISNTTITKQLK